MGTSVELAFMTQPLITILSWAAELFRIVEQ